MVRELLFGKRLNMKVTFISCTNPMMAELIGKEGTLGYSMTASFSFDAEDVSFDFRHGYITTSIISSITITEISFNCYEIKIQTRNSEYVFRKGELSDKKPLTKDEILAISSMMF